MAVKQLLIKLGIVGDKESKAKVDKVEKSFTSLGTSALKAGAVFFTARGIINGIQQVTILAAEQELAEKRLAVALGSNTDALLEQATALQRLTVFGDEVIISQQAFLASLDFTQEQIKEIIPLALDLSSATGMELDSAVRNVAKTFSGLQGELGELIPQLKELTKEELQAGGALKVISELMGGQAVANADSLAGKLEQTKNAVFDAGEALGELLGPAVIHTANAVSFLSNALVDGAKKLADLIVGQEEASDSTMEFSDSQAILAENAKSVAEQIKFQEENQKLLNTANEKVVNTYEDQIKALELQKMELEGASDLQMELFKLGIEKGSELRGILGDQVIKYLDLKMAVNTLRKFKEKDALQEKMSFKTFKLDQLNKLDLLRAEEENIKKFIELYPEQARALGLVNAEKKKGFDLENMTFQTTLSGIRNEIKGRLSQAIAGAIAKEVTTKGLAGVVTGTAVAVAISSLFDKYVPAFAEGGIVGGVGNQDTVPAMLTPGELILNKAQQENLVGNMGSVNVNIQGNLIGEESFVRDILVPEIEKARTLA
tara:strand:+ start:5461 stop:7098 length:1638 start_codon:yes stop_codon:yes gene_type:complete